MVSGEAAYDVYDELLSLDLSSSAPPEEIARFIGPELERVIEPYRLEGAVDVSVRGCMGVGDNPARDLRFHIDGQRLGWRWFTADHIAFDAVLDEDTMTLRDIDAVWCNGKVSGLLSYDRQTGTFACRAPRRRLEGDDACPSCPRLHPFPVVAVERAAPTRKTHCSVLMGQRQVPDL